MKFSAILIRALTLVLVYTLGYAFLAVILRREISLWLQNRYVWHFFASALVVGLFVWRHVPQASFYHTLRHELCHWLFATLSRAKPYALQINGDSGGFYSYQGRRNYLIVLAPYFFPITSFALILISLVFTSPSAWYYILMGTALAFDAVSMCKDYHKGQTDWQHYGIPFSLAFAIPMYVLSVGLVLVLCLSPSAKLYAQQVWHTLLTLKN